MPYQNPSCLKSARVIVGNSSSGIIESTPFQVPAVNIGTRQAGREQTTNIIDVDYKKSDIKKAITKALYDKKFIAAVKKAKSPYGNGTAGKQIAQKLGTVTLDKKLLEKKLTY